MSRIYGVVTGEVIDNNDPEGEGRVKVRFAWLPGDNQSYWAPVATFMTGNERGSWFMPEIGDEVLVAFGHGDVNHPYVLGFLWNGDDRPPISDGITTEVRRLRTVSGHELQFDDRSGQEQVYLKTAGGHELNMDDVAPANIEIKTTGGQTIKMSDMPPGVEITTSTGHTVTMSGADITITSPSKVTINSAQAEIVAGLLTVNAGFSSFSGVVQAQTLIANSVISTTYSPGVGNIW